MMDYFRSVTQSVLGTPQPGHQPTGAETVRHCSLCVYYNNEMPLLPGEYCDYSYIGTGAGVHRERMFMYL